MLYLVDDFCDLDPETAHLVQEECGYQPLQDPDYLPSLWYSSHVQFGLPVVMYVMVTFLSKKKKKTRWILFKPEFFSGCFFNSLC